MKRRFAAALILAIAVMATACGNKVSGKGTPDTEKLKTEELKLAEAEIPEADEDGQNPVMNFIGSYAAGRANIDVSCEGQSDAKFLVTWGSSAFETSSWEMSGTLDQDTLTVPYTNCVKQDIVFDEDGTENATVAYENGTGTFTFTEDGRLLWQDDMENAGEDMVFLFGGGDEWNTVEPDYGEVDIDLASSDLYSGDDRQEAVNLIRAEFDTWDGCVLHSLLYAGDECNSEDNIKWMNELNPGQDYTQCMEFLSSFHSPVENAGAWDPDTEYEDYQWWLARANSGSWELISWGY